MAKNTTPPPPEMAKILSKHQEALVIFADPGDKNKAEAKVAAYIKLLDKNSKLSPLLTTILRNLLNGKECNSVPNAIAATT